MAIQIQGNGGVVAEVDGSTFRAQRVTVKPNEYGAFGHFQLSTLVPLLASQTVNGTLFSFRWGDATRLCIPVYIRLECIQTVAATATIMPAFDVVVARGWTVSDSTGTAITLTGNNMKKRTNMGTTLVTDIRKSSATGGLTAGTRTLDSEAILQMPTVQTITTTNTTTYRKETDFTNAADHPLVFAQNEGFIIRGPSVGFGVAGTASLFVEVAWLETLSY